MMMLLLWLLFGFPTATTQQEPCTLCADGSTPVGSFNGGTDCAMIDATLAATAADDELCRSLRLEGFQSCECPTIPLDFCQLCSYPDGYQELQYPEYAIPDTAYTCAQAEFLPFQDCVAEPSWQWYCGCPGEFTRPNDCTLCQSPNTRLLPPQFEVSCQQLDRQAGLLATCETLTDHLPDGFMTLEYCGCASGILLDEPCQICSDSMIRNPAAPLLDGLTCADLGIVTEHLAAADDYCQNLQTIFGATCCDPTPAPTVPVVPTAAPVVDATSSRGTPDTTTTTSGSVPRRMYGLFVLLSFVLLR